MKRIIQTPVRAYPYIGGVEIHVHNLATHLMKDGFKVTVVAAKTDNDDAEKMNYKKVLLPWLFKITNTQITWSLPFHLLNMNYDLVHSHIPTPWSSDLSMLIGKIRGKKTIITIHNDMNKGGFIAHWITKFYVATLMKFALYLADVIIVVNNNWRQSFIHTRKVLSHFDSKIVYIPNGVDTNLFKATGKKVPKRILCVSILDKYHDFKGIKYLLQGFKIVLRVHQDATLEIVGEGELSEEYKSIAIELGLSNSIFFTGELKQKDLVNAYSRATVLVLPSTDTEGFGLVLLEALACETPVITTKFAGVAKDIVKNDCGLLIQARDANAIADSILQYLDNKELTSLHGKNGRKLVKEYFSWGFISRQVANIYMSEL